MKVKMFEVCKCVQSHSTVEGPWQNECNSCVRTYLIGRELFLQTHVSCRKALLWITTTWYCASLSRSNMRSAALLVIWCCLCLLVAVIWYQRIHKCWSPTYSTHLLNSQVPPFLPIPLLLPAYLKKDTHRPSLHWVSLKSYPIVTVKQLRERVPEWNCDMAQENHPNFD